MSAHPITGVAAGVPFVAVPPVTASAGGSAAVSDPPVVLAWHLQDAPRTEAAFAAALPLEGLAAWRIYLGLPMSGSRLPAGEMDEFMRLGGEDAVLNIYGPVRDQAVAEVPAVLAELGERFGLGHGPLALLGGSMGAAVAGGVMADRVLEVSAAVLVSPLIRLRPTVAAMGRRYGVEYPWSGPSQEVADRLDLVARADDVAGRGQPAVLLVVGGDDDADGVLTPAAQLRDALAARYRHPENAALVTVPGMPHALADEPGIEPAVQNAHAAQADRHAVEWLRRHLVGGGLDR
jgi:pimeloyl-ACP methyl ester carboxylesterase